MSLIVTYPERSILPPLSNDASAITFSTGKQTYMGWVVEIADEQKPVELQGQQSRYRSTEPIKILN